MYWIRRHFWQYYKRKPWDFCWRIAIESTLVMIIFAIPLWHLGLGAEKEIKLSASTLLFWGVIIAPVFETLIFQSFPIMIARQCKARFSVQVIASVFPFFIAHTAVKGIWTGLVAGLIGGFYLAFTYVHWREVNGWTALWTTTVSHAIHNGIAIPLYLLSQIQNVYPN